MGFFREIGKGLGGIAGTVLGTPIQIVGEITGAKILEDIGDGVKKASTFAGDTVGQVADGTVNTVSGIWHDDPSQRDKGLSDIGNAVGRTATGVIVTAKNAVENTGEVIVGAIDGDMNKVKKGASGLATTVAIGAIAIGVIDVVDGAETANPTLTEGEAMNVATNGNPDIHHVEPHYVEGYTRADGTEVSGYYRDGDGNPNTQLSAEEGGGYYRSNPDGNPLNNLKG
ncbi:hypothetical protein H1D32_07790 [Anaerobacillus sp. CMMVII]|uniref:hypothetical protein n=1 Tax=Anaerobacillus sp. CMMVII TaxID=2755588 RepID=UPI0021B73B0C|nr:hypothetical protein [Anaerobacillus sp. CMMVII]MCT8137664.1 hypothetical protein [Anaerobacillus sp. CMMVII]